jgi:hypothetical protein
LLVARAFNRFGRAFHALLQTASGFECELCMSKQVACSDVGIELSATNLVWLRAGLAFGQIDPEAHS